MRIAVRVPFPCPGCAAAAAGSHRHQPPSRTGSAAERNRCGGRHCQQRRRAGCRARGRAHPGRADCDRRRRAAGAPPLPAGVVTVRTDVRVHAARHDVRYACHGDAAVSTLRSCPPARSCSCTRRTRRSRRGQSVAADEHGLEQRDGAESRASRTWSRAARRRRRSTRGEPDARRGSSRSSWPTSYGAIPRPRSGRQDPTVRRAASSRTSTTTDRCRSISTATTPPRAKCSPARPAAPTGCTRRGRKDRSSRPRARIGNRVTLVQRQGFKKNRADAKLKLKVTKVFMQRSTPTAARSSTRIARRGLGSRSAG